MPEFTYTGAYGRMYPESRDAANVPVGAVNPGDTRDLDAPLDGDWLPCDPPALKAAPKSSPAASPPSAGPPPVPGVVTPGSSQPGGPGTSTEAGVTGEEG